ncbi:MAG: SDR family oxidoreductase [Actinomycetota bacterium]
MAPGIRDVREVRGFHRELTVGRFDGANVIVTGGSSGIGRATVLAFAGEGAQVLASGRDEARLAKVKEEAPDPARVVTYVADLRDRDQVRGLIEDAIGSLGRVNALVNNAGIGYSDPVLEMPEEHWDETFAVNLDAPFFASRAVAKHMIESGGGSVVNIASTDAFQVESPQAHYNASKAALVMMTRSFAHELGHLGIRFNCVAPGETMTPMLGDDLERPEFRSEYLKRIPMRRAAEPEEIAKAVLFLASDEASFVNGETLVVDGGQMTGDWYEPGDSPPVPEG